MKILTSFLALLTLSLTTSCGYTVPSLEVTVRVLDDDGKPVANAEVGVGFQPQGSGGSSVDGYTNSEGIYSASGRSNLRVAVFVEKNGYYPSRIKQEVQKQVSPGKWEIVDQDVTLVLRKIEDPIPMYAKKISGLNIPEKSKYIGFDFEAGDWVAPYGDGKKADLLVLVNGYYNGSYDQDATLRLSFSNPDDGFIEEGDGVKESEFISPYRAPLSAYKPTIEGRKASLTPEEGRPYNINTLEENAVMVFRLRTEVDENGNVKKAQYGKIYDGFKLGGAAAEHYWISFTYYLNPTVNDRNLEFAVGQSLIPNLRKSDKPKQP